MIDINFFCPCRIDVFTLHAWNFSFSIFLIGEKGIYKSPLADHGERFLKFCRTLYAYPIGDVRFSNQRRFLSLVLSRIEVIKHYINLMSSLLSNLDSIKQFNLAIYNHNMSIVIAANIFFNRMKII